MIAIIAVLEEMTAILCYGCISTYICDIKTSVAGNDSVKDQEVRDSETSIRENFLAHGFELGQDQAIREEVRFGENTTAMPNT